MKAVRLFLILALAVLGVAFAAETVSTDTLTVTTTKRTWRIQIFTDYGSDYRAEFLREELKTLPDHSVLARAQLPTVARALSNVAAESVTVNGKTITGAELAEALKKFGDKWAAEDLAAAEQPPASP